MKPYECARCDAESDTLPPDWQTRPLGASTVHICAACAASDARPARAVAGHNSGDAPSFAADDVITGAAQTRLRTLVERIERLEEDKAQTMGDIKEVYDEAKGEGFDTKILRKVVALRKKDKIVREEEDAILDLYLTAVGDR